MLLILKCSLKPYYYNKIIIFFDFIIQACLSLMLYYILSLTDFLELNVYNHDNYSYNTFTLFSRKNHEIRP